ncbi:MAG: GH36-type glycosyl hydrolase domain-containing protein [Acidobacteriota bacterium]
MSTYGHFSPDHREFIITNPMTPAPWVNYMWNHRGYCGLVSHCGGGYSYFLSPRDNRLTRFRYNALPWDQPGRYIYLRDKASGRYWSLSWAPTMNVKYDFYECRHGQGYTTIVTEVDGLRATVTYFVPRNDDAEIWMVALENKSATRRMLDVFSYAELLMGNALNDLINQCNDKHFSDISFNAETGALFCTRRYWMNNRGVSVNQPNQSWPYFLIFGSSLPIRKFDGSKDTFIGRWRSDANPEAIERGECFNTEITAGDPCAALQSELTLHPGESVSFTTVMGIVAKPSLNSNDRLTPKMKKPFNEAKKLLEKFRSVETCQAELEKVKAYWTEHLDSFQVATPDENFNAMINVWNRYQTAVTFDMARNAGYYHGGLLFGTGIRDQMQDMWGPLLAEPKRVKDRIKEVASYQFSDGSTLHNFFRLNRYGEKTGHSDTPQWLPVGVMMYLKETADFQFLKETVPFYDKGSATIEEHVTRALDYVISQLTKRNLPKFGPGDWNDTLDYVGRGGKGETVWGAGFLCYNLKEAVALFNHLGKKAAAKKYSQWYDKVAAAVNKYAWDGEWYVRGFKDNGEVIGSKKCKEGKIFIEPQPWAILSGIAPEDRAQKLLASVKKHLDTAKGVKILHPAFTKVDTSVGLATRCVPGKKENAAVFNHASSWLVMAELMRGNGDRAWEVYKRMLPPNVGADSDVYTTEPYVYSEYVTSPDHETFGQASHSWLTGSAVWMYRNATDWLVGLRPTYEGLLVDPCVPSEWKEFSAVRSFRGAVYAVTFENPDGVNKGVKELWVDGTQIEGRILPMGNKAYQVRVVMG